MGYARKVVFGIQHQPWERRGLAVRRTSLEGAKALVRHQDSWNLRKATLSLWVAVRPTGHSEYPERIQRSWTSPHGRGKHGRRDIQKVPGISSLSLGLGYLDLKGLPRLMISVKT